MLLPTFSTRSKITDHPVPSPTYSPTYTTEIETSNVEELNKSTKGIMFSVKAKQDITIRALDVYARRSIPSDLRIYTKPGQYQLETSRNGWGVIFDDTVQLDRESTILGGLDVHIGAGSVQSFFVYVDAGMRIKGTATAGEPYDQDDAIVIYSGTAYRREFYNTIGYGQYAGSLKYDVS
jgi:hypothetical protein